MKEHLMKLFYVVSRTLLATLVVSVGGTISIMILMLFAAYPTYFFYALFGIIIGIPMLVALYSIGKDMWP